MLSVKSRNLPYRIQFRSITQISAAVSSQMDYMDNLFMLKCDSFSNLGSIYVETKYNYLLRISRILSTLRSDHRFYYRHHYIDIVAATLLVPHLLRVYLCHSCSS